MVISVNPISEAFCKSLIRKPDKPFSVDLETLSKACVEVHKLIAPAMERLLKEEENENSIR